MWSRRNLIAIGAIFAVAIVVIVATAIFAQSGHESGTSTSTSTTTSEGAPPPSLDGMLLDRATLGEIMGNVPLENEFRQDFLSRPPDDWTSIPACRSVDSFADASLYADTPWRGVRVESFRQSVPNPPIIRQSVVWVPDATAGKDLFKMATKEWGACKGKPFSVAGNRWVMQDFIQRSDIIIAITRPDGPPTDWSCQHALGVKGSFVAEGQVCGTGTGQAERVVQEVLAKVRS